MKRTTTLMDIIQSELVNSGENEFKNKQQMTFFNDDYAFIKRLINYDPEVEAIVTKKFFGGVMFDAGADKLFKRAFVNKFLNREIAFQTLEDFTGANVFMSLSNASMINTVFNDLEKFLNGEHTSESDSDSNGTNDNRTLNSTLPQNNINLDVDNTILDYGDDNSINRNKSVNSNKNTTKSDDFNINNLIAGSTIITDLFNQFDKKLFSQVY